MRKTMTGLAAVVAVITVSAQAPAMACGGYTCGYGSGYGHTGHATGYAYTGYPAGHGYSYGSGCCASAHTLPTQYYYVNQGPTYTGPGAWAPYPTYQERAVSGWSAYSQPYYYGYNGGPYANPSHHYYDGAIATGPQVIRYQRPRYATGYRTVRYLAPRPHFGPRIRLHSPGHHGHHRPILRRYN